MWSRKGHLAHLLPWGSLPPLLDSQRLSFPDALTLSPTGAVAVWPWGSHALSRSCCSVWEQVLGPLFETSSLSSASVPTCALPPRASGFLSTGQCMCVPATGANVRSRTKGEVQGFVGLRLLCWHLVGGGTEGSEQGREIALRLLPQLRGGGDGGTSGPDPPVLRLGQHTPPCPVAPASPGWLGPSSQDCRWPLRPQRLTPRWPRTGTAGCGAQLWHKPNYGPWACLGPRV